MSERLISILSETKKISDQTLTCQNLLENANEISPYALLINSR